MAQQQQQTKTKTKHTGLSGWGPTHVFGNNLSRDLPHYSLGLLHIQQNEMLDCVTLKVHSPATNYVVDNSVK